MMTISKASRRGLLCLLLVAALLGQNFRHVKAEAAIPRAAAAIAMLEQSTTAQSSVDREDNSVSGDVTMKWPKCDCCKHCAQPVAVLGETIEFTPMRAAHATDGPAYGVGARPPHPDEPPRA